MSVWVTLQDEAWAAGGSGILLRTTDGGKSWARDRVADQIAANLYSVKYVLFSTVILWIKLFKIVVLIPFHLCMLFVRVRDLFFSCHLYLNCNS
jgi:hypothetical protein